MICVLRKTQMRGVFEGECALACKYAKHERLFVKCFLIKLSVCFVCYFLDHDGNSFAPY